MKLIFVNLPTQNQLNNGYISTLNPSLETRLNQTNATFSTFQNTINEINQNPNINISRKTKFNHPNKNQ